MTLRQLEYFLAVIGDASFTRAAQRLHVSQPALSHQIRALEKDVGCVLIQRPPAPVAPTAIGEAFLPVSASILRSASAAADAARAAVAGRVGELQVATLHSVAHGVLPAAIGAWVRAHPGVHVETLEFGHPDILAAAMAGGAADIAVGPGDVTWSGPSWTLGSEEFVLVLPLDDPSLAGATPVLPLESLAHRRWVLFADDHGLSSVVARACAAAGFTPRAAARTYHTGSAIELASAGIGPALVPANAIGPDFERCVAHPAVPIHRELVAYTRPRPSSLARAFVDILVDHATV